jgi:pyruvate/2-oxoglutarate dehydrogenase complex dihydrolipoamide acyltransferase (E2) component
MSEPVPVVIPRMNPNDEDAVIVCWHVTSGSRVEADQPLVTVETTKATFEVNAPQAGYVSFDVPPKTMVTVGAIIAWISDHEGLPPPRPTTSAEAGDRPAVDDARFTRKALRLMERHGLRPSDFTSAGRVEAADVERVLRERESSPGDPSLDDVERLEQSPSKQLEVARLAAVYEQAIPSTVSAALSCERVDRRLQRLTEQIGPVSLLELAIHDVARLLGDFPELNAFYANGQAWRHRTIAVGFAINAGRSLRVPIVRRAAELSEIEIARSVRDLSLKYMRNELTVADMSGGTFTITNLAEHGVVHFVPVLNDRQSAILGICAERPGSGYRELIMTFDHRLTDGMRVATFLGALRARLEAGPTG